MPTTAQILQDLRNDPQTFLRHYYLSIAGGAAATTGTPSGQATFSCGMLGGTVSGFTTGLSGLFGMVKNREKVRFTKIAMPPRNPLGADEFDAWYVAMAVQGSGAQTTHFTLPGNTGPDLMLTSQLSGCTFGVGSVTGAGARLVSHIQPLNGATDQTTRTNLHNEMVTRLTNGVDGLFERENRPGDRHYGDQRNRASIIGVRRGTAWEFWAQEYRGPRDGGALLGVTRIL